MKSARIAKRYAKALFLLAQERGELDTVRADMVLINQVCSDCKDFLHIMQSPIINTAKKISIFKTIFQKNISSFSCSFLEILAKKRRELIVGEIAHEFLLLYDEYHNIKTVLFKTAVEPEEKIVLQLKEMLTQQLNANINIVTEVKKDLIGGFIVKVDHKQIDASIRRNINRLKREYHINIYVPRF